MAKLARAIPIYRATFGSNFNKSSFAYASVNVSYLSLNSIAFYTYSTCILLGNRQMNKAGTKQQII